MKSAIATSIRARALGSIELPQSFIWVTGPLLGFFWLKNELRLVLLGVFLLLILLEVSVTDQGRFKAGRTGELSVLPPVSPPSDDLGDKNANTNGGETYSKLK
jgi:hypothetical protein